MSATINSRILNPSTSVRKLMDSVSRPGLSDEIVAYDCGHCERSVAGILVARISSSSIQWLLCPSCGKGSVRHRNTILPSPLSIPKVDGLPPDISQAYDEARNSFSVKAYTGCEILCRKILMSVAVNKGAKKNQTFESYVDYLKNNGYITVSLKDMADTIRKNGNESTHEIRQPDSERSEYTLEFTAQVLRSVYEIAAKFSKYQTSQTST